MAANVELDTKIESLYYASGRAAHVGLDLPICVHRPISVGAKYLFIVESDITSGGCALASLAIEIKTIGTPSGDQKVAVIDDYAYAAFPLSFKFYPHTYDMEPVPLTSPPSKSSGLHRVVLNSYLGYDDLLKWLEDRKSSRKQ